MPLEDKTGVHSNRVWGLVTYFTSMPGSRERIFMKLNEVRDKQRFIARINLVANRIFYCYVVNVDGDGTKLLFGEESCAVDF